MKTIEKLFKPFTYVFIITALMLSCAEDGDPGPEGPEGEAGVDGQDGINGTDGQDGTNGSDGQDGTNGSDGEDGNAEVMYSDWIPANFTGTSDVTKYMKIDFPDNIPSASSIKNTHIILVYFSGFGDGNVYLLPVLDFRGAQFTYGYGSGSIASGDINIKARALSGVLNEYQIDPDKGAKLRYVIIPPTINISGRIDLDYSDYDAVINYFGISE